MPLLECDLPERELINECALIDELDLVTIPVTHWSTHDVVGLEPDTRATFSVTVTLTASVSVTWSW